MKGEDNVRLANSREFPQDSRNIQVPSRRVQLHCENPTKPRSSHENQAQCLLHFIYY